MKWALHELAAWILALLLQRETNMVSLFVLGLQQSCWQALVIETPAGTSAMTEPHVKTVAPQMMVDSIHHIHHPHYDASRARDMKLGETWQTFLLWWFAKCGFFALGNSHLMTTIDISKSYTGLSSYSQVRERRICF